MVRPSSDGTIANITPAGPVIEVDMPRRTGAAGLGPGPDGNLWIIEGIDHKIARFDLSLRTFWEVPTASSWEQSWYHHRSGWRAMVYRTPGRTNRAAYAYRVTDRIRGPTPNAQPFMIITVPDGTLWFTEYNAGKIGRITTAGNH